MIEGIIYDIYSLSHYKFARLLQLKKNTLHIMSKKIDSSLIHAIKAHQKIFIAFSRFTKVNKKVVNRN